MTPSQPCLWQPIVTEITGRLPETQSVWRIWSDSIWHHLFHGL